jgi:hypothetical protein
MKADGDADRHEDGHEMSTGGLDELFGFADEPEFLQVCERGRAAFSEAVIDNSVRRSGEMVRRRRLDQLEGSPADTQRGPRVRSDVRLAVPDYIAFGVKRGARVTGTRRAKLVSDLRKQYEKGVSIRTLAERTGRSYGFVRRILGESGVQLRGRGGATRSKKET